MTFESVLNDFEISNPPTTTEIKTFLNDQELDFQPRELVQWMRDELAALEADHRHCAGCPRCSKMSKLRIEADYFEAALAILEAIVTPIPRSSTVTPLTEVSRIIREHIFGSDVPADECDCCAQALSDAGLLIEQHPESGEKS